LQRMRRGRHTAWLLLVTLLLLMTAGCGGGTNDRQADGPADEQGTQPGDATSPTDAGEGPASTTGDGGSAAPQEGTTPADNEPQEWTPFTLKPGQYFKYKTSSTISGNTETGTYTLELSDAGDGRINVAWEGNLGDSSFSSTVTVNQGEEAVGQMFAGMMMSPAAAPVAMTILAPWWNAFFAGRNWTVGNNWSFSADGHSASFEITGRRTYAGVQGYVGRWTEDGELRVEMCVSPDVPLALMTRYVMDDQVLAGELVEYRGP